MSEKPVYEELAEKIKILEAQSIRDKQALKVLKDYSKLSEKILTNSNAIIIGLNKRHRIVMFNKGAEKLTGFKIQEVIDRDWFKIFFKPEVYDEMENVWKEAWGIESHSYINPIQIKNGDEKIIAWRSTGIYDDKDETGDMLISMGEDITEQKLAEKKLYQNLQFTNTLQ